MKSFSSTMVAIVALGAFGCTGSVQSDEPFEDGTRGGRGGSEDDVGDDTSTFKCDREAAPRSTPLRRLTSIQYRNTLKDLLTFALKDEAKASTVMKQPDVTTALQRVREDQAQLVPGDKYGSYRRLAQDVNSQSIEATYDVALAIAAELTTSASLPIVVGACATDTNEANDGQCLTDFINRFGSRASRRTLAAADVDLMKKFYGSSVKADPLAYADLISGMLTVPHFLYHVEHGTDDLEGGKPNYYRLNDFELASRLSYQFTQSMPDEELFEAARKGALTKDSAEYERQINRLMGSEAAKATVDEFFYDQLKLFPSKLRDLDKLTANNNQPTFKKLAGANLPTTDTAKNMREEVLAMARYFTWEQQGTYKDLLTTDLSFAKTDDVAKLYGVPAWKGSGTPPSLPAGERPGFLTRAAFLASGKVTTRPIVKGVFIREHVLCEHIPPPPANAAAQFEESSTQTTREVVEAQTEQPNTSCRTCHQSLINPLGFATEAFDSLGRKRTMERLFNKEGIEGAPKPINTTVVPKIVSDDATEVTGAKGLVDLIAESGKAQACFARGYFRFTFQRWDELDEEGEKASADGCLVERLRRKAVGGSLADTFKEVALAPQFKARLFD